MNYKERIKDFIIIIIGGIIILGIMYGLTLFWGGSILSFFGLEYDSFSSLAKFLAIYMIISLPVDLFVGCFFTVAKDLKNLTDFQHNALYFGVDVPFNMLIIGILEFFMKDIKCSILTAFLFSIVCCLFNFYLDNKAKD